MRYPPSLLDDIRARLPVSAVVSRKVALKKAGREFKGLSPFKTERTPSFFVNDQKGFYHCFASGEHGDIFKFLMRTEGLTFPEAVERLAGEAGVPLPKFEARDPQVEDQRTRLYALLEASAQFFATKLMSAEGAEARRYIIEKRGLSREAIARFRLGYAPSSRNALKEHLAKAGYSAEEMALSGMLIAGPDIPVAYDRFRDRVMFPIGDLKDRPIAFGGRALDASAPAKYLNSPETPLFHKGSILYHAARARTAAYDRGRVIAVEGYMDVVALAEAGFVESVAPLGTALTEDQVRLLWRMSPEPILCFDGDSAGRKAAFRAVETVLPHLKPGTSVRFAFLPDGLDPDDLIRQDGAAAMETILSQARPLAEVLWEREWGNGDWSTPERRARLEQQMAGLLARIADASVRGHYEQAIQERFAKAWGRAPASWQRPAGERGGRPRAGGGGWRAGGSSKGGRPWSPGQRWGGQAPGPANASSSLKNSSLVAMSGAPPYREAILVATLLHHPWFIAEAAEEISALNFTSPAVTRLRDGLLELQARNIPLDTATIRTQLTGLGLDKVADAVARAITHRSDRFAEAGAERVAVETGWRHAAAMHDRQVELRRELASAEKVWRDDPTEAVLEQITETKRRLAEAVRLDEGG